MGFVKTKSEAQSYVDRLLGDDRGPAKAALQLLLIFLPRLQKVQIFGNLGLDDLDDLQSYANIRGDRYPVCKDLSTIELNCDHVEIDETSQGLAALVNWPGCSALKDLKGSRLSDIDCGFDKTWSKLPGHLFSIEKLNFEQCHLEPETVEKLLIPIKNLQDFSYEEPRWNSSAPKSWIFSRLIPILKAHTASTVKRLSLTTSNNRKIWRHTGAWTETLRAFTALESVNIATSCFIGCKWTTSPTTKADFWVSRLVDSLPSSVQAVRLHLDFLGPPPRIFTCLFDGIVTSEGRRSMYLPNLSVIYVKDFRHQMSSHLEKAQEQLDRAGFRLIFLA